MEKRPCLRGQSDPRRGVLLLVVLAMLAMFALIAVTFVILSNHERRAAEVHARVEQYADSPVAAVNEALAQVLRGSDRPTSVMRTHGLLEDMYGDDAAEGWVIANPAVPNVPVEIAGGQIIEFSATGLSDVDRRVGNVLTVLHGRAGSTSTRIVGYNPSTGRIQIASVGPGLYGEDGQPGIRGVDDDGNMTVDDWTEAGAPDSDDLLLANGRILVNGTAFGGTGVGYDPSATGTDPQLGACDAYGLPYALMPNPTRFTSYGSYNDPSGPGGANEPYDAFDYQNMLMAMQLPEPTMANGLVVPPGTTPIPSLQRPSLIDHWFHRLDSLSSSLFEWPNGVDTIEKKRAVFLDPLSKHSVQWDWQDPQHLRTLIELKRRIMMGPSHEDNPNFADRHRGSLAMALWDGYTRFDANSDGVPDYSLEVDFNADGTIDPGTERLWADWDVDNDGDGIADSIWVDIGLPIRSTPDGRLYRPLVAILCVDLAGRLDLNAHGCPRQTDQVYYQTQTLPSSMAIVAGNTTDLPAIRGQNVGPAEINLATLLPLGTTHPDDTSRSQYDVLLHGIDAVVGRYGADSSATAPVPGAPTTNTGAPYDYPAADPLAANDRFDYPGWYDMTKTFEGSTNSGTGAFGSPLDLHGTVSIGLDLRGQPLYVGGSGLRAENPYELNLLGTARGTAGASTTTGSPDAPFSPAELEALLRAYDVDANELPGRLAKLAPALLDYRREVTTDSFDLPCPAVALPPELRKSSTPFLVTNNRATHFVDLLQAKLRDQDENSTLTDQQINRMINLLLPPEMIAGLRMDLNRPLGNGWDDNDNDVIDEPGESDPFYQVDASGTALASPPACDLTLDIDINNDGTIDHLDQMLTRQLYARHLYVMMLLLMNYDANGAVAPNMLSPDEVARQAAQWAVNVVDFRDRDSIMTAFEYDRDPFTDADGDGNPWDVDNDLTTDDGSTKPHVVWGCERPELLITETMATHDRATQDTAEDPSGKTTSDNPPDEDYDQKRHPKGSLFIELHNPWSDSEPKPGELYETTYGGVDLTKTAPDGTPVWRLVFVDGSLSNQKELTKDPDDHDKDNHPTIDRAAYFVDSATNLPSDGDIQYYRGGTGSTPIAPIKPGRYAVIGPDDEADDGQSVTYLGLSAGGANTRRIELRPSANPDAANQVRVYADGEADQLDSLDIQPPTAIILGGPGRLSVTEPTDGYDDTGYDANAGLFVPPLDVPLDKQQQKKLWDRYLRNNGTFSRFAKVHLQRLANPLLEYDSVTNPYRTIDAMQVDLTSFNGAEAGETGGTSAHDNFHSRERGENGGEKSGEKVADDDKTFNLWPQVPVTSTPPLSQYEVELDASADPHVYDEPFACTFGYLNEGFWHYDSTGTSTLAEWYTESEVGANYMGSPRKPFPWLTWLNRPLASPLELMLVPKARSSQLLLGDDGDETTPEFTLAPTAQDTRADEVYDDDNSDAPFRQLVNFFQEGDDVNNTREPDLKLHRLLEFVRVPSPFTGTELQGDPETFAEATGVDNHRFNPPFNRLSFYREPGKINLNTITSLNVWRGLMNFLPNYDAAWRLFVDSRRGYSNAGIASGDQRAIDAAGHLPTRFANPFRSFAGAYLVPNEDMQKAVDPSFNPLDPTDEPSEINATLLRPVPGDTDRPLFAFDTGDSPANDTTRNPAFRYQLLSRLSNMTTTRSNVYAVWVTVGYFEVEPWTPVKKNSDGDWVNDQELTETEFLVRHPDGYRLGRELGTDGGEIKRHRAFSIIDRSIPVGFQRGEDHNVENAILLRRFIE